MDRTAIQFDEYGVPVGEAGRGCDRNDGLPRDFCRVEGRGGGKVNFAVGARIGYGLVIGATAYKVLRVSGVKVFFTHNQSVPLFTCFGGVKLEATDITDPVEAPFSIVILQQIVSPTAQSRYLVLDDNGLSLHAKDSR